MPVAPLFKPDGTFKIIQIADLHYSVGPEPCREVARWMRKTCKTNTTQEMVENWLDMEKPDMVVFSGEYYLLPLEADSGKLTCTHSTCTSQAIS